MTLFAGESRRLFVGDPGCRDHQILLGAAWECLKIAARKFDFDLEEYPLTYTADAKIQVGLRQVISGKLIAQTCAKGFLCFQLERRRCYRGRFTSKLNSKTLASIESFGWKLLIKPDEISEVAKLYDQ